MANPSYPCGAVQFSIENQDGTAIDSGVLTLALVATVGTNNRLSV